MKSNTCKSHLITNAKIKPDGFYIIESKIYSNLGEVVAGECQIFQLSVIFFQPVKQLVYISLSSVMIDIEI